MEVSLLGYCEHCDGALSLRDGLTECVNVHCPQTVELMHDYSDHATIRCGNCGSGVMSCFLRGPDGASFFCTRCGTKVVIPSSRVSVADRSSWHFALLPG